MDFLFCLPLLSNYICKTISLRQEQENSQNLVCVTGPVRAQIPSWLNWERESFPPWIVFSVRKNFPNSSRTYRKFRTSVLSVTQFKVRDRVRAAHMRGRNWSSLLGWKLPRRHRGLWRKAPCSQRERERERARHYARVAPALDVYIYPAPAAVSYIPLEWAGRQPPVG